MLCWKIWNARCGAVFEDKMSCPEEVLKIVERNTQSFSKHDVSPER